MVHSEFQHRLQPVKKTGVVLRRTKVAL